MRTCTTCGETKPATREYFYGRSVENRLDSQCKKCRNEMRSKWLRTERGRASSRKYYTNRRLRVLQHYSGKDTPECECCGETFLEFLAMDHINGGGEQHRSKPGGRNIYYYLLANDFPDGYRVLCHNCNQSIGYYGYCPHTTPEQCIKIQGVLPELPKLKIPEKGN